MNLYELIAANTAALEANTKALLGAGGKATTTAAAATTDKPAATKPAATKPTKPKGPTREETVAALTELKDKLGAAVAKELIADSSSVTKMADIPDGELAAVFAAVQAKLKGEEDGEATTSDDGL